MPERQPLLGLLRRFLFTPLALSIVPLLFVLWAIENPVRGMAEKAEARAAGERVRAVAAAFEGSERWIGGRVTKGEGAMGEGKATATERLLLKDGAGHIVFDSAQRHEEGEAAWRGPRPKEAVEFAPPRIAAAPGGGREIVAEARWGSAAGGGSVVLLRSLEPLDRSLRRAVVGAVLLWLAGSAAFAFWVLRALRELRAEREDLARGLGEMPGPLPAPLSGRERLLDLDGALRETARRVGEERDQLREERRERDAVLHGMAEGVVAVDLSRRVILLNEAAERILGVPRHRAAGRPISEVVRNGAFLSLVERALRGEPAGGTAIEMEMEMETATGTVTEAATATGAGTATGTRSRLRVRGDALRGDDGTPSGAVLVLADVTEIRRLERIRRDFVANVSHELKTPITAIRGYAETLLEDVEDADSETRRRFLGILEKQASRMNRIIEDLLALSRLESTGGTIERSCFDPRALAERAVRDAEGEAARRGVRIDLQTPAKPGPLAPLWANEALLERALGNLIDNALKYGARDGTVRVAVEEDVDGAGGGGVRFSVADEGPGIPAEHLHRLFERFYRVDKGRSRELGGTGLGLAIVKHIALVHGGEAGVESEEGRGSVFHLRIPRRRPPDSAHARREPGGAR